MPTDMFPSRGTPATHSHAHIEGKFRFSVNLMCMFLVCGRKLERAEETQAGMESTRTTEEKFPTAATKQTRDRTRQSVMPQTQSKKVGALVNTTVDSLIFDALTLGQPTHIRSKPTFVL